MSALKQNISFAIRTLFKNKGFTITAVSAATGELVAAQIAGGIPAIDPAPYAPARFGL